MSDSGFLKKCIFRGTISMFCLDFKDLNISSVQTRQKPNQQQMSCKQILTCCRCQNSISPTSNIPSNFDMETLNNIQTKYFYRSTAAMSMFVLPGAWIEEGACVHFKVFKLCSFSIQALTLELEIIIRGGIKASGIPEPCVIIKF